MAANFFVDCNRIIRIVAGFFNKILKILSFNCTSEPSTTTLDDIYIQEEPALFDITPVGATLLLFLKNRAGRMAGLVYFLLVMIFPFIWFIKASR